MSKATSNVNITSDTFSAWVDKTNELRYALNTEIVTANATFGNTVGNCHVNGYLAGNTIIACANIGGGSIIANSSSLPEVSLANAVFITNTVHTSNTFFMSGTVVTDDAIGNHSNTHAFSSNVTFSGVAVTLASGTKLLANGVSGNSLDVLSSNGSSVYWRSVTEMQLLDSVSNTSVAFGATANAVTTAYNAATANVFIVDKTFNANLVANGALVISRTTPFYANGVLGANGQVLTSNGSAVYWATVTSGGTSNVQVLDSVSNTSIVYAAAANSVATAYNAATTAQTMAISANTRAASAQTAAATAESDAQNANTRAASAQTAAIAAYSNAIAFAANATNLSTGTIPAGRLTGTYSINISGTAGSVAWTSVTGRPTDLASFTNGPGYVTSSGSVAFATTAGTATTANAVDFSNVTNAAAVLRHVSSGYTSSARLFAQTATPTSPVKGDIWFQI